MSGTGPESMPTSADPRSKRPVKKRALSPASAQASQLEALFARPDQEIRVPPSGAGQDPARRLPLPPEIVTNVQGSSAGAGSGEFHVYKAARRREYERLRIMDEEVRRETDAREFAEKKSEAERKDDEKTRRNREKREKMKARKEKAKAAGQKKGSGPGAAASGGGGGGGGGLKPRQDGATGGEGGQDQNGKPGNGASNADPKGDGSAATAAAGAPGLVIHDDDD
ncbi:hypothetical protein KVR01_009926 [Diaporthe batatas]|uniref:uncharacterized protein n=1 Tax=Diaporthe batatas TaxID=748121 RepID=UPI001D04C50B|nr:uncharacterized protein KVR01_009926 [Diaporthe batatas]KAG8160390.1 hypothetical protein KVR01_009926 [Diaporthe batatas]